MKKLLQLFLILILSLIPSITFAEEVCDPTSVKIEAVEINDTRGNIEENNNPTSNSNELNILLSSFLLFVH